MSKQTKNYTSALIVEGGAMRGIFGAGVLDSFIEANFYPFDYYFGVSAGASNVAAYLGRQKGRNYKVYTEYCLHPNFKSWRRFLAGGHLIDIDWLWDVTERDLPIGLEHIDRYFGRFFAVATCAQSAKAHYLTPKPHEVFRAIKASGNMPFAFKGRVSLYNQDWLDGGVADSLPVQKAYDLGARRLLVLRSNPKSYVKQPYKIKPLFPFLLKKYPQVAHKLQMRHHDYNQALSFIRKPPADCDVVEICTPDSLPDNLKVTQFTTDKTALDAMYSAGLMAGKKIAKHYGNGFTGTKKDIAL